MDDATKPTPYPSEGPWVEFERTLDNGEQVSGKIRAVRDGQDVEYETVVGDVAVRVSRLLAQDDSDHYAVDWGDERQITEDYAAEGIVLPLIPSHAMADHRSSLECAIDTADFSEKHEE